MNNEAVFIHITKFCIFTIFEKHPPRGVLKKRCSEKYAANLQENTHAECDLQLY